VHIDTIEAADPNDPNQCGELIIDHVYANGP